MEELISFWVPVVIVPIALAHAIAYVLVRFLSTRFSVVPNLLKVVLAGLSPTLAVIGYFWIWTKIDFAMNGPAVGDAYMGPMVFLVTGWPILLAVAFASFFFAVHIFYSRVH